MRRFESNFFAIWLVALSLAAAAVAVQAGDITPAGQKLGQVLDSMHVDQLWLAGRSVDWRTGEPRGKVYTNGTAHTHCSAFAAAAAEKLGVYLLHPPEHSSTLLANAQQDWLKGDGAGQGWKPVDSPIKAQELANEGQLVVVTCKNPDGKLPGHIAIVRPSDRSDAAILEDGPEITQAGGHNYLHATTRQGFKNHPGAFEHNELLYFSHNVAPDRVAQQSVSLTAPQVHPAP